MKYFYIIFLLFLSANDFTAQEAPISDEASCDADISLHGVTLGSQTNPVEFDLGTNSSNGNVRLLEEKYLISESFYCILKKSDSEAKITRQLKRHLYHSSHMDDEEFDA